MQELKLLSNKGSYENVTSPVKMSLTETVFDFSQYDLMLQILQMTIISSLQSIKCLKLVAQNKLVQFILGFSFLKK